MKDATAKSFGNGRRRKLGLSGGRAVRRNFVLSFDVQDNLLMSLYVVSKAAELFSKS